MIVFLSNFLKNEQHYLLLCRERNRKGQWGVDFIRNLISHEAKTDFPFKISTSSVKNQ